VINLGFVDVLRSLWWWSRVYKQLEDGDIPGHKRLRLSDGEFWSHPELTEWGTIRSLLGRAQRLSEINGFHLVKAAVEVLEPNVVMPWHDNVVNEATVYLCLYCEYPRTVLYEDVAAAGLVSGHLWAVGNNAQKSTLANFSGRVPAVNMVLNLKRERQED
jgi:hypothetical protein